MGMEYSDRIHLENKQSKIKTYTFATLPNNPQAGDLAVITDAGVIIGYRANANGGGTNKALVMFNGTNWIYH